jgi:DNA polymerase elongation subunit (family B)
MGYDVIYWDTDSIFTTCKDDISDKLNVFIQDWAKLKGKDSIELAYEYEGYFEKIFIIALCRYLGVLVTKKGKVPEIKGAEAKRANSTKCEGAFQKALIDRILNKDSFQSVVNWVEEEKKRIKLCPLEEIAFPCKISNKEYAVSKKTGKQLTPVFVRAVNNTNSIKKLDVPVGEVLWWTYVEPKTKDDEGKDMNVFAFTRTDKEVVSRHRLDWDELIRRNIQQKAITIF